MTEYGGRFGSGGSGDEYTGRGVRGTSDGGGLLVWAGRVGDRPIHERIVFTHGCRRIRRSSARSNLQRRIKLEHRRRHKVEGRT